jgi:hypothetical protein
MTVASSAGSQSSSRIGTFSLVFGICFAILYVVCDMGAFPMFTYHPGPDRFDFGFTPPRRDEGPAMYWYGWIAKSALGASLLGLLAAVLPEKVRGKIPLALAWIAPVVLLPVLIYSLKFYWRWE